MARKRERISIFMVMTVRYVFKFTFVHSALSSLLLPLGLFARIYRNLMGCSSPTLHSTRLSYLFYHILRLSAMSPYARRRGIAEIMTDVNLSAPDTLPNISQVRVLFTTLSASDRYSSFINRLQIHTMGIRMTYFVIYWK